MAPNPPTIVSLKQSFLTTQTRLLSQPLAPTNAWRNHNNSNREQEDNAAGLPEKAVDDALFKLNHRLQQHARRVYAPQATRHVAEQIDQLYWNAAEAATTGAHAGDGEDDDDEDREVVEGLSVGADLADPSVIAALPSEWDVPSESAAHPLEAKRYAELAGELRALAERKQQALARVARLRRMKELLEPFSPSTSLTLTAAAADGDGEVVGDQGGDSSGGGAGVQENLVTRNGEIEAELQRMRVLLARVGGRVGLLREKRQQQQGDASQGGLGTGDGGETAMEVDDVDMDVQKKVGQLLESF